MKALAIRSPVAKAQGLPGIPVPDGIVSAIFGLESRSDANSLGTARGSLN